MSKKENVQEEIRSVSIADFEVPVLMGNYPAAEKVLQVLMFNQREGKMEFKLSPRERTLSAEQVDTEAYQVIEKLATLITKMFSDPQYVPSPQMFKEYALGKRFIANLFSASSYQTTDHIVRNLGLDKKGNFTKEDIRKFLITYTPESSFDLPWLQLARHMPAEVSQAYLGLMASVGLLMSEMSIKQLNKLAATAKDMPEINFSRPNNLELMASGYFHVSNLTGQEKYEFKKWSVKNYCSFMNSHLSNNVKNKIQNKALKQPTSGKQTVVIVHEHYRKGHAMYRCFHSLIAALSSKFKVVGVSAKGQVDELGKQDHHEFFEYDDIYDFDLVISDILKQKPDIMYYPSIGMTNYVPALATQRLAPIQCMTPGHPSSSMFETIDYIFYHSLGKYDSNVQSYMTEKALPLKGELNAMTYSDFAIDVDDKSSDVLKIAVNGVLPKVTNELIKLCQKITKATNKAVEFQFFLNHPKADLEYYAGASILRRLLPNSKIHFYQDYNTYMNTLAECSLAIPTIPFGGSNSNIDCVRVGLPKLFVIDESDFVGYSDYQIWENLGILDGLCSSMDELIERAAHYIDKPELMFEYKESMKNLRDTDLFSKPVDEQQDIRLAELFLERINAY